MIIEKVARDVTVVGVLQLASATIANSSKVFDFFATQTYSDKFKAIVRELVSNALDAHTEAGNINPVDVYLPDALDPYFRVKDQGVGMPHDFCMTNFMQYSDGSTKDGSDLVIGGFGIGSKSPFAYTDQWTLRSVHNGMISVYSVFKDDNNIPTIGLLSQSPTNEINGVEFSLPVEVDDFSSFIEAAQNHLGYFFDRVRLHGGTITPLNFVQRGDTWAVRNSKYSSTPNVVMGGVAYPVAAHNLGYENSQNPLLNMPLDLFLPIGSCSVTLSRESLLYDDKTKAAIITAVESIVDEITADIPTMFDNLPGQWEACKALHAYLGGDQHTPRSRLVLKHAQYLGKELRFSLEANYSDFDKVWTIDARRTDSWNRRGKGHLECPSPKWSDDSRYLIPANYAVVIVDDLPPTSKSATIKRIKTYVNEELDAQDQVLVIRPLDHADITPALTAFGNIPACDYILTSSLPEPAKVQRDKADKLARPIVRMFELTYHGVGNRSRSVTPCRWSSPLKEIPYADQPANGVLVVMDNFTLPEDFWKKFFLFEAEELRFVNKSDASKLKNFTLFEKEFETRLAAKLAEQPTLAESAALQDSCLADVINLISSNPTLFDSIPKTKPLFKIKTLVDQYIVPRNNNLLQHIVPVLPARVDPDALLKSVNEAHWKMMTFWKHCDRIRPETPEFKLMKELI